MTGDDRLERGARTREAIFGPGAPGGRGTQDLAPFFSRWVLESVFGDIWSRPALGAKLRVLLTVVALAVLRQQPQLESYLRNALRVGWTREELVEVLVHLAPYAGVPAVHNALDSLRAVLAEGDGGGR
ncbi:MAG TPA: carboxymuconolactone decarboxylase family protein [Thermodesulfobacteriota bacterium]|nr:carboxymuconolactone decarboxylase family protein [Thermodesulfobacteriota bacterium]